LGAGDHFVRFSGRVYERIESLFERRPPLDIYHAALEVHTKDGIYGIEQAPVPDLNGSDRGVVAEGPVGARWAGRFRIFRYEVRVWHGGDIPDVAEAVDSPRRLTSDAESAQRVLEVVPSVPRLVWGRDELGAGEMWNSNAVIAWVLVQSGLQGDAIQPPAGGRAPGWNAGLKAAGETSQ
jgi:hypothetical protein